ncbi:hypothetical protein KIW84_071122 [Lathyrus oleraceus]|uniref:Uncharacterized protein n=1 Tax=Pisum sativum TaxID=3888 RepID=A0A9D4ZVG6_PEA|nr:hypothetical protein KIW84_071122 [Pisum sativum]
MSTGKKGPSCCQSRTCKSSLYRGRPLTSPTVQGPSDRPVTRQAAAWHAGKAFFARNPCKFQIFQHQIKYFSNQNQILDKFLEIFHLLAHVCAPICLVALCCSSCLARRNRRCCMLPFACVPWHCGVWYVLRCWILLSWGRMSGIAIVCVCWLYAFAWNVKKLVVGPWVGLIGPPLVCTGWLVPSAGDAPGLNWPGRASGAVTLKKLERTTAKAFAKDVFINQERKLGARRRSDTVLVSTINDADQGSADVAFRTPLAPYEKSKSLGSGGSMVARLKLKGIDGRAPPGVEPAA